MEESKNLLKQPNSIPHIERNGFDKNDQLLKNGHITPTHANGSSDKRLTSVDENLNETKCGLGPCTPKWLQVFTSKQMFLVIFSLAWVLQGMYSTYFASMITTIEKLFQIQSKTTGLIMSASELGQIGSSLLLTYYGGQSHRPKWIACGMFLFAISSFACTLPHFIFGDQLLQNNHKLFARSEALNGSTYNNATNLPSKLCRKQSESVIGSHLSFVNLSSDDDFVNDYSWTEECYGVDEQKFQSRITNIILLIFFVSLFCIGMGQTAVNTLGIPFIDDNVASRESPMYLAIIIGIRILGPVFGYLLGSVCTMIYVNPFKEPGITPENPHWIGAWWLGMVFVAAMLMLASIAMFSFPQQLNNNNRAPVAPRIQRNIPKPKIRDFPKAVKRLLKNNILMLRTASSVLHLMPIAGLYTFLPKYLETQFRLPAHTANMVSGVGGILVMGVGILISGFFIRIFKPSARSVAAWVAITAIVYAVGMGVLMFTGCPMSKFAGISPEKGLQNFIPGCNRSTCGCEVNKFNPVCGSDGQNYISACHAGCQTLTMSDKHIQYSNCTCIEMGETADPKICDNQCTTFVWYILAFSIFIFIHSTSEVGRTLLTLRCVEHQDKAMALGLIQFAIGIFGNAPCPFIYGAVVDSTCLFRETTCGEPGACWLYNTDAFRQVYHGMTGGILLFAFIVDIVVWHKASSIIFVHENSPNQEEEMKEMSANN